MILQLEYRLYDNVKKKEFRDSVWMENYVSLGNIN